MKIEQNHFECPLFLYVQFYFETKEFTQKYYNNNVRLDQRKILAALPSVSKQQANSTRENTEQDTIIISVSRQRAKNPPEKKGNASIVFLNRSETSVVISFIAPRVYTG